MANDKPCLHLPLDEIRIVGESATAANVGSVGGNANVRGNPTIVHDPTIGTCMRFDGEDDYLELTELSSATFAQGMTVMVWACFEETPYFSRIFDLNVAQNQKSNIVWAGNEERSRHLAFEIEGVRFRVDDGVALRQWRHYAFVFDPAGTVSIIVDGALAFSKDVAFDVSNTAWQTGYVGKSSFTVDKLFRGLMAHFRLYNHALTRAEINDQMIVDRGAMAHYRETTLLKVDLYTIRDDDHKPILYVEAANKGEPLEVSVTNPTDKPVAFKSFSAPTADDFQVQLRFRRNVIAPNVLRALRVGGITIDGWQHAVGTTADGREDYISLVKQEAPLSLDKGDAWRIQIPDFSAAAQGGARNTRIQVRYRTEPQDPGSVVRHMEVQSHLGLKTIPLIARFRDSNTILNNGSTSNKLIIEVAYTGGTGSVRLDDDSKFELIVDDELISVTDSAEAAVSSLDELISVPDSAKASVSSLEAVSRFPWLEAQPPADGRGHKTIAIKVKRPAPGASRDESLDLMEVSRGKPITLELSGWVTNKPSGTYNILLRYENIPGYWDGAWVLPVQFSPLLLRSDKIGIGTDEPNADLEIRRDTQGAVGPVLRLTNAEGGAASGVAVDFNVGPPGQGNAHEPTFRIEARNDARDRTDLVFVGKSAPDKDSALDEKARITADGTVRAAGHLDVKGDAQIGGNLQADGRLRDRTGFVMPVGAILSYGGSKPPEGWLLCNGDPVPSEDKYAELREVVGRSVPDLRSRFIAGAGEGVGLKKHDLNSTGGTETVAIAKKHLPAHTHEFPYWRIALKIGDNATESIVNEKHPDNKGEAKGQTFKGGGEDNPERLGILPPYYALTYIIKY